MNWQGTRCPLGMLGEAQEILENIVGKEGFIVFPRHEELKQVLEIINELINLIDQ